MKKKKHKKKSLKRRKNIISSTSQFSIDHDRLNAVIQNRLTRSTPEIKKFLPKILSTPNPPYLLFWTDLYLLLAFIDKDDYRRVQNLLKKGYPPFPGLVAEDISHTVAFRFEKSKNAVLDNCGAKNLFTLRLGKDVTVVLRNHAQSIKISGIGPCEYIIKLAYIISFGDEINRANLYNFLDDLIAYSVQMWRQKNAPKTSQ